MNCKYPAPRLISQILGILKLIHTDLATLINAFLDYLELITDPIKYNYYG